MATKEAWVKPLCHGPLNPKYSVKANRVANEMREPKAKPVALMCSSEVFNNMHSYHCSNKAKVEREVIISGGPRLILSKEDHIKAKSEPVVKAMRGFCKVHDPEVIAAKKKVREDKWEEQSKQWTARRRLDEAKDHAHKVLPDVLEKLEAAIKFFDANGGDESYTFLPSMKATVVLAKK